METDSGAGAAVSPLPVEDAVSSSQMKKLVVKISEFKETLSVSEEFSCHREVTVVQRRSTSRDKTERLQKPRSTAGAKKYFCLALPSTVPPSTLDNSPHHASVLLPVPDSVVPGTPSLLSRRLGKITRTKHTRERRLLTSSSQLSAVKSTSSATLAVAYFHTSVVCPDVSAVPQPAVATSNRFSLLGDEVEDLESLAGTVVDPLASPLPDNGAAEPVGPTAPIWGPNP